MLIVTTEEEEGESLEMISRVSRYCPETSLQDISLNQCAYSQIAYVLFEGVDLLSTPL